MLPVLQCWRFLVALQPGNKYPSVNQDLAVCNRRSTGPEPLDALLACERNHQQTGFGARVIIQGKLHQVGHSKPDLDSPEGGGEWIHTKISISALNGFGQS